MELPNTLNYGNAKQHTAALVGQMAVELGNVRGSNAPSLSVSGVKLQEFDSSALSVLLSLKRAAAEQGAALQFVELPAKLQRLALAYGLAELI